MLALFCKTFQISDFNLAQVELRETYNNSNSNSNEFVLIQIFVSRESKIILTSRPSGDRDADRKTTRTKNDETETFCLISIQPFDAFGYIEATS